MYQKITIVGNLGRDPEMKYMPDGTAITNMSVAVKVGYGEKAYTQWWRVAVWGKQAEACILYLKSGRKVLVEGEVTGDPATGNPRTFTRKDGTAGASHEIRAQAVKFLSGRDEGDSDSAGGNNTTPKDGIPF